jgi:hypothetical protein
MECSPDLCLQQLQTQQTVRRLASDCGMTCFLGAGQADTIYMVPGKHYLRNVSSTQMMVVPQRYNPQFNTVITIRIHATPESLRPTGL